MTNRSQRLAATTGAHSSFNSPILPTANRAGTFNLVLGDYTEEELEAAATMLTLSKPVVYSKEDLEAANILLALSEPDLLSGSDSERTVTAERTPVPTPNRPVTSPTPTPAPAPVQPNKDAGVLPRTPAAWVSPPTVKKISLGEYTAIKKARKDREAQKDA